MILDKILADRKQSVEASKCYLKVRDFERMIEDEKLDRHSFKEALGQEGLSFIAEVKKASPSKGIICEDFEPVKIAKEYDKAKVSAVSVLTEPKYFLGSNKYLRDVKENITKPILRKDFIFDEWQVYETCALGADAMLLIVAMLETYQLKRLHTIGKALGLDLLVEVHDEKELEIALEIGAEIIGVNNRNLKTFEVNLETTAKLRAKVPQDKIFVAESGIHTREDVAFMEEIGVDAVLIGESFMRAENKLIQIDYLRGKIRI